MNEAELKAQRGAFWKAIFVWHKDNQTGYPDPFGKRYTNYSEFLLKEVLKKETDLANSGLVQWTKGHGSVPMPSTIRRFLPTWCQGRRLPTPASPLKPDEAMANQAYWELAVAIGEPNDHVKAYYSESLDLQKHGLIGAGKGLRQAYPDLVAYVEGGQPAQDKVGAVKVEAVTVGCLSTEVPDGVAQEHDRWLTRTAALLASPACTSWLSQLCTQLGLSKTSAPDAIQAYLDIDASQPGRRVAVLERSLRGLAAQGPAMHRDAVLDAATQLLTLALVRANRSATAPRLPSGASPLTVSGRTTADAAVQVAELRGESVQFQRLDGRIAPAGELLPSHAGALPGRQAKVVAALAVANMAKAMGERVSDAMLQKLVADRSDELYAYLRSLVTYEAENRSRRWRLYVAEPEADKAPALDTKLTDEIERLTGIPTVRHGAGIVHRGPGLPPHDLPGPVTGGELLHLVGTFLSACDALQHPTSQASSNLRRSTPKPRTP